MVDEFDRLGIRDNTIVAEISAKDKWQLYQITEDFSEANDLAGQDPKRLADLQLVFDEQAKANRVYPGGGFNAPIRSRRRPSTLDKSSNIVKLCRQRQLTLETSVRKDLFAALTLAMLVSGQATAIAGELTGTLAKVKELGYITIGHREASVPFSYLDDKQQPVGFAIDICARIVDAVKRELKLDKLEVRYQLVTASTRIPLLANGTIDLECGNTTNNAERQQQVWYTNTHFLTASRFVSKVESKIGSISDLKGKTIVSPAGSTNIKQALEFNSRLNLGMTIIPAQDQAEAFLMVETDRAVAFVQDDIVLAGLIANAKDPKAYVISEDGFSKPEPYGIMLRKDDTAFKAVADGATASLYQSPSLRRSTANGSPSRSRPRASIWISR